MLPTPVSAVKPRTSTAACLQSAAERARGVQRWPASRSRPSSASDSNRGGLTVEPGHGDAHRLEDDLRLQAERLGHRAQRLLDRLGRERLDRRERRGARVE